MKAFRERSRCTLNRQMVILAFGWIAAGLVWAMIANKVMAQGCCEAGGHNHGAAHDDSHAGYSEPSCHLPNGGLPPRTPHGGVFLETGSAARAPSSPKGQHYLAAAVDVTGLPDEAPIAFHFENLPDRKHSKAEFTPFFYQSEIRPYVVRVSFVQVDREGYAQQRTCPVTGALLGSMGEPVKVLVGERPLCLCCAGCIENVKESASGVPAQPISNVIR